MTRDKRKEDYNPLLSRYSFFSLYYFVGHRKGRWHCRSQKKPHIEFILSNSLLKRNGLLLGLVMDTCGSTIVPALQKTMWSRKSELTVANQSPRLLFIQLTRTCWRRLKTTTWSSFGTGGQGWLCARTFDGHTGGVGRLKFSRRDSNSLASVGYDSGEAKVLFWLSTPSSLLISSTPFISNSRLFWFFWMHIFLLCI